MRIFIAKRKMFGQYCLLLVTVGYLNDIDASMIRYLPYWNSQKLSVASQENDMSGRKEYNLTRSSNLTPVRPSQNLMVQQAPAPIVDTEEGSYFEGDIILRPEQHFSSVSIFLSMERSLNLNLDWNASMEETAWEIKCRL
jgi:hypothetical protein